MATHQPIPVFLPREFHAQRTLVGDSPQGRKESDTLEATYCACACPPDLRHPIMY